MQKCWTFNELAGSENRLKSSQKKEVEGTIKISFFQKMAIPGLFREFGSCKRNKTEGFIKIRT